MRSICVYFLCYKKWQGFPYICNKFGGYPFCILMGHLGCPIIVKLLFFTYIQPVKCGASSSVLFSLTYTLKSVQQAINHV